MVPLIPPSYWQRQATLTDFSSDLSLRRRLGYNIIGLHVLAEHPLLGVGPGNYKVHYMDPDYRWMPGRGVVPRQLHNMYLEVATETGVVGLICFLGMLYLALRSLNRVRKRAPTKELRDLGEALHFAFVGLLIASAFVPNEYNKYVWIFTGLGVALGRIAGGAGVVGGGRYGTAGARSTAGGEGNNRGQGAEDWKTTSAAVRTTPSGHGQ